MRLSLNASTIKPTPLLEKIRVAGEAGYSGIELWAVEIYEYIGRGGEVRDVEKALADHGLDIPAFIAVRGWGDVSGLDYKVAIEEARRRFELAARFGAPLMICTPPVAQTGFDHLHKGYSELLQIGSETGVQAVMEYISFFKSLNNLPDVLTVLDRSDADDATGGRPVTILDAFHNWNNKTTLDDIRDIPLERISHYHINDAPAGIPSGEQNDSHRVMVGDGIIDLKAELTVLKNKGYDKWISLELFNAEWWSKDPLETAKVGLERMRTICDEVGFEVER